MNTQKPLTPEQESARLEFGQLTPMEARARVAELKASKEFTTKLYGGGQGHSLARAAWDELHRIGWSEPANK